jgi:hypothetical protein
MKAKLWFLGGIEVAIAAMYLAPYELGLKIFFAIVVAAALAIYKLAPRPALAAGLVSFVVLMVVGVISVYSVPGLAQVARAKDSVIDWRDQQSRVAECDYRQQAALEAGNLDQLNAVEKNCTRFSQRAVAW